MKACLGCWWQINVKRGFGKDEPAMRYCGHPRHTKGDMRANCEDWYDRREALVLRDKQNDDHSIRRDSDRGGHGRLF